MNGGVQRDSDGRYVYFVLASVGGSDRGAPVCESRVHGPARAGGSPAGAGSQPSGVRHRQSGRESEIGRKECPEERAWGREKDFRALNPLAPTVGGPCWRRRRRLQEGPA